MPAWNIAAVQMDCTLADVAGNLRAVRERLRVAADAGARLVLFPECVLSGYCYRSKDDAWPHSEPVPGPAADAIAEDCAKLGVFAVVGLLERDGERMFNTCLLAGPGRLIA